MDKVHVCELLDKGLAGIAPARRFHLSFYVVDPYKSKLKRLKNSELVFVVARGRLHVVFFDDVEDEFATASESEGCLTDIAYLGELAFALEELDRLEKS